MYVDGDYAFSVTAEDYFSLNLYEKKEIAKEEIDHIKNTVNFRSAKSSAIKFLSLKIRTEQEVRKKLERDGYDRETSENAVNELKAMGYINDRMYVQKYVFDRSKLKPKAKNLIRYELQNKGIDSDEIDEVLDDWDVDEKDVAASLVRRKFGKYDLQDEKIRKKVYAFLSHRGYGYELIESLFRNEFNG